MRCRSVAFLASSLAIGLTSLVAACSDSDSDSGSVEIEPISYEPLGVADCVVWVHGKTDRGADPLVSEGRGELSPHGNAAVGGGLEWQYAADADYADARQRVAEAIDGSGCEHVVISGFSNGAAFAGKLYCRGESFDGRLRGVVIDDPVPDRAVLGCTPDPTVEVALYWTGALAETATPDAECAPIEWTCEGERLLGIDAYAEELEITVLASPFSEHRWYRDSPEIDRWLDR